LRLLDQVLTSGYFGGGGRDDEESVHAPLHAGSPPPRRSGSTGRHVANGNASNRQDWSKYFWLASAFDSLSIIWQCFTHCRSHWAFRSRYQKLRNFSVTGIHADMLGKYTPDSSKGNNQLQKSHIYTASCAHATVAVLFFLATGTSACASAVASSSRFSETPFSSASASANFFFSSSVIPGSRGTSSLACKLLW